MNTRCLKHKVSHGAPGYVILTANAVPLQIIIQYNFKKFAIMKKKMYEKPSMKVVLLKQRTMLLAGSVSATRSDYDEAIEQTWN